MKSLRADLFVDAITDDMVTVSLADGGETFDLPKALMPLDVSEGWIVRWTVERATELEAQASGEVAAQLAALLEGDHLAGDTTMHDDGPDTVDDPADDD